MYNFIWLCSLTTGLLARQVGLNQSMVTEWAKASWRSLKKWKCVFISRRCRYRDL